MKKKKKEKKTKSNITSCKVDPSHQVSCWVPQGRLFPRAYLLTLPPLLLNLFTHRCSYLHCVFPSYRHLTTYSSVHLRCQGLLVWLSKSEEKQRQAHDHLMTLNRSPWFRSSTYEYTQASRWSHPNEWVKCSSPVDLDEQVSSDLKFCTHIRIVAAVLVDTFNPRAGEAGGSLWVCDWPGLVYRASSRTTRATRRNPVLKNNKQTNKQKRGGSIPYAGRLLQMKGQTGYTATTFTETPRLAQWSSQPALTMQEWHSSSFPDCLHLQPVGTPTCRGGAGLQRAVGSTGWGRNDAQRSVGGGCSCG